MGGGASVAARAAGMKALKGRRYLRGMKPEKYFEEVLMAEYGETFEILGINELDAFELFTVFIGIDDDNSGEVSVDEFHDFLELSATKFSERVFTILDLDMSGSLDFREYMVGVWNYCTYDTALVAKMVYGIFDVDNRKKLSYPEYDAMVRMLTNKPDADADIMKLLAIHGDEDDSMVSYDEFLGLVKAHFQILLPAFELQRAMRRKMLGVKYWETQTKLRTEMFKDYDTGDQSSWEAVESIITIKHRERVAALEAKRAEVEEKNAKEIEQLQANEAARHEEDQLRRIKKLEKLVASRLPEEVQEEAAWEVLRDIKARWESELWTEERLGELRALRVKLWDAIEDAIAKTEAAAKAKEVKDTEVAVNEDAEHKTEVWIKTKAGAEKFAFMCKTAYGELLRKEYSESGALKKTMAPMYGSKEVPVTLAVKVAYSHPNKRKLAEAREAAKAKVVAKYAAQELAALKKDFDKAARRRKRDFTAMRNDMVEKVRGRMTQWEILYDSQLEETYLLNLETKERHPEDTAICENCDRFIPINDVRCYGCEEPRSAKNLKFYKQL